MYDNRSPLDKLLRRNAGYSNPVYDPNYVYAPSRKWIALAVVAIFIGLITWFAITNANKGDSGNAQNATTGSLLPVTEASDGAKPIEPLYQVEKVVDGDTIDVSINGKTERIRLIGMDTPETVDPRTVVQCFGKEASDKAKATLTGAKVRLEQDATQGERDKYGRILAYVFLEDGSNFNKYMISEGYAHEYTYNVPYKYQQDFKAAQADASNTDRGLWSPSTCNGNTSSAASTPAATTTQPSSSSSANTAPSSSSSAYYANCSAARAAGVTPIYSGEAGYRSGLDRDRDGIACE